jgi:hypothetical protein
MHLWGRAALRQSSLWYRNVVASSRVVTNRWGNVPSSAPKNTADHNAASVHARLTLVAFLSSALGVFSSATSVWYDSVLWSSPSNEVVSSPGVGWPVIKAGGRYGVHSWLKSRFAVSLWIYEVVATRTWSRFSGRRRVVSVLGRSHQI